VEDKQQYQQLEEGLAKCQASAESELVNYEISMMVADALRALRNKLMVILVQPLKTRMDKFLTAAGLSHRSYCRLENDKHKPIFELGWVVDDTHPRALPAMSGGESAIFCAALAYAIVELADPPLKLLLLEVAEVDQAHLGYLLDALVAVGETGMQVIAATHLEPQTEVAGVNVILCGVGEPALA